MEKRREIGRKKDLTRPLRPGGRHGVDYGAGVEWCREINGSDQKARGEMKGKRAREG